MSNAEYCQAIETAESLFAKQQYEQAIATLRAARLKLPDHQFELLWQEALISVMSGMHDECLDVLEEIVAKKYFGVLEWGIFDSLRANARFDSVARENQVLRDAANIDSRMQYEVLLPKDYSPTRKYPLFIALHGDSQSLAGFMNDWGASAILSKGFILAYVQSSQMICTNGFGWTESYRQTRSDIGAAYHDITGAHAIDTDCVIVGGFSGGAIAALEIIADNTVPATGFISLCPSLKPDSFIKENIETAARRGVKGVIMEGEMEGEVAAEQYMLSLFREVGLPHQFHVNPDIGHAIPRDLQERLVASVEFILAD